MNNEVKEILDYFQKDVDKYEESKKYLMEKYGYDEETIDNIYQHKRHINTKILLDYITNLQQENQKYKEVIDKAIEYMKDFIFEPLLTNEDRKLIMYNDNLRNFEKILKEVE